MAYATQLDYEEYNGMLVADQPQDMPVLLERASELVDTFTLNRAKDATSGNVKKAVCAQVEYWLTLGTSTGVFGSMQGFSAGKLSVDFGEKGITTIAPRAKMLLFTAGLLSRGVRQR